jgi:hypothetical protein
MTTMDGEEHFFGDLRAVVMTSWDPLIVVSWTAVVEGASSVVEVTFGEAAVVATRAALEERAARLNERLRSGDLSGLRKPEVVAAVASLPDSAAPGTTERRGEPSTLGPERRHRRIARVERSVELADRLSPDEAGVAPYANDAVFVAALLARGHRAPAKALAEVRGISVRSAQGRIARSRKYGLLTPVPHGVIAGEATKLAIRIATAALEVAKTKAEGEQEVGMADG